jgi:hypothetical protein
LSRAVVLLGRRRREKGKGRREEWREEWREGGGEE